MSKKLTPPLRWHGAKSYLAKWLWSHMPEHTVRLHACAGAWNDAWNWPYEGFSEIYNDVNGDLTNLFLTLQSPQTFERFCRRMQATPLSMAEFTKAKRPTIRLDIPDETWAAAFFVRIRQSRQGLGRDFTTPTSRTRRGMNEQVSAWLTAVDGLAEVHERLRRVEIVAVENEQGEVVGLDCCKAIQRYDSPKTLHVVDPPYHPETRSVKNAYEFEMTSTQHEELLHTLSQVEGKFMLSGRPCPLYDAMAEKHGWRREDIDIDNKASNKREKVKVVESVWMNY